jgi:hypothetical protein
MLRVVKIVPPGLRPDWPSSRIGWLLVALSRSRNSDSKTTYSRDGSPRLS